MCVMLPYDWHVVILLLNTIWHSHYYHNMSSLLAYGNIIIIPCVYQHDTSILICTVINLNNYYITYKQYIYIYIHTHLYILISMYICILICTVINLIKPPGRRSWWDRRRPDEGSRFSAPRGHIRVCIYMWMYVYVCVYIYIYICMYICNIYIYIYTLTYLPVSLSIYTYIYIHTYV